MNSFRRSLLLLLLALITGGFLHAKDSPKAILERLPQTIADCQKGDLTDYGKPELGYSVAYQANGLSITAYVYDLGRPTIADGIADPGIVKAFELAKSDIKVKESQGAYSGVRLLSEARGSTLRAKYELVFINKEGGEVPVFSEIHVFGAWNQIIKLRITGALKGKETTGPIAEKFVTDFVKAIQLLPPRKN
jgi:hypothetical protein